MEKNQQQISTREEPQFEVRAKFAPGSYDEKERSVNVILSTEKAYTRYDFFSDERYDEILPVGGAVFNEKLPLLDSHSRVKISDVIGSIVNIRVESDAIVGKAIFASTEKAKDAEILVKEGHLTDISIGYKIEEYKKVLPGNSLIFQGKEYKATTRTQEIVTKYKIFEGSLTPVGANDEAKVKSFLGVNKVSDENNVKQEPIQQPEQKPQLDLEKVRLEAAEKERARIAEITDLCRTFSEDSVKYIADGSTIESVRSAIFEKERQRRASSVPTVEIVHDSVDKTREYIENCLAYRMGLEVPHAKIECSHRSLIDLAREFAQSRGVNVRFMDNLRVAKMVMQRSFSHGSSDFANLLAGGLTRRLQKAYQGAPSTYELWCNIVEVADFREQSVIRMSEGQDLDLIAEGAPYPEKTFSEVKESYTLQKYGKLFVVTWEAIINDDLRFFDRLADLHGYRARRKPNALAYAILTANAALGADSTALFHAANHFNLGSAALAYDSLSAGRTAIRKQKGADGIELNLNPTFLIVPPDLETTADELTNSITKPSATWNSTNVMAGKFTPVVESILSASSTTAWYLAASPSQIDTVEVAFLQGYREPVLEEEDGFDVDGRKYKVMIPCVAKAIDYRGLYKGNS